MPSTDLESATFTQIDWTEESSGLPLPRRRTIAFVVALLGLAALFAYDFTVNPEDTILEWDISRMDWLFLISSVLFGRYAVAPLLSTPGRSIRLLKKLLTRPAGALSFATILALGFLGLFGPNLITFAEYPRIEHSLQPPVFTSVYVGNLDVYICVGEISGEYCHGSWRYPLGTIKSGENIVQLLLHGIRIALQLGISAAMIMAVVATVVGTTAGYFGGWIDDVLMGYVDVQQTIPAIVVYVVVATMFLGNLTGVNDGGLFTLALVFGLLDWGGIARLVRSEALQRRSDGYVRAAKAAGASNLQIIRKHVIPNSSATVVTALTRRIPLLILAQVALAYLELNRAGSKSLGRLMRVGLSGRGMAWHQKWWVTGITVVVLVIIVVAFNVLGDTVRDVLNPQEGVE